MIILGIDPGSVRVGFGAIANLKGTLSCVRAECIEIPHKAHEQRLFTLEKMVNSLLVQIQPDRVAVEKLFFTKNQKTALHVAEARGVILTAVARKKIPLIEITPTEIKRAVTGSGKATKQNVAHMVRLLLSLSLQKKLIDDITDALAIAIATSNPRYINISNPIS